MENNIKEKSLYCLNCKVKPCSNKGCPLNNNIPAFIEQVKNQNLEAAFRILENTTVLQAICGRICPHRKQCEGSCVRGIKGAPVDIGSLEAFVGDYEIKKKIKLNKTKNSINKEKKVAIVGGGPARVNMCSFSCKKWNKSYNF